MRAAPKLQQIVTQMAEKHGMNLKQAGAYLRLAMPGFGQLVIENIGADRVSIANYVQIHADWHADPEIVVFVASRPSRQEPGKFEQTWYPIEVTEVVGGWQLYGEVDTWGEVALYDPAGQHELATMPTTSLPAILSPATGWSTANKSRRPWRRGRRTKSAAATSARTKSDLYERRLGMSKRTTLQAALGELQQVQSLLSQAGAVPEKLRPQVEPVLDAAIDKVARVLGFSRWT